MTTAQRLNLRCFAEGIEIPVISAVVGGQPNGPATCSIQIPANDYAMQFKPRTLIHLFFYDFYNGSPPESEVFVAGQGIRRRQERVDVDPDLAGILPPETFESTPQQEATDSNNANFKLLFVGELMGVSMVKQPSQRAIVLQCIDLSSYWDLALQYQVSGFSLGGGGTQAAFTGAATTLFNSFLDGSGDIIIQLMEQPPKNFPELRGTLLGAIVHIIEAIGGVYFGRNVVRGVNDFFSLAEMRLHLTQMVGANPFPNRDEERLMRANGFGSLFHRSLAGLGKMVSIRAVINALQRYIFHETVPITSPRYIPPSENPNLPHVETVGIRDDPATLGLARVAARIKDSTNDLIRRQNAATDPQQVVTLSRSNGGLLTEFARLRNLCTQAARTAHRIATSNSSSQFPGLFDAGPGVEANFAISGQRFEQMRIQNGGDLFQDPRTLTGQRVLQLLDATLTGMDVILNSQHHRRGTRTAANAQADKPQRLLSQIYRPDVWMVAPPRCNVLFPELYSSFEYGRDFMKEVTRLMLRTHSAFFGSDMFFDGWYMTPSRLNGERSGRPIGRGRVGIDPPDLADAPAWFIRDLMHHELFTGIIPAFERMSDLNLHALRGGSLTPGQRVDYAQRAADFIFFKYRYRQRVLQATGKFNPFFVLGFPALLIDKPLSEDRIRNGEYDAALAANLSAQVADQQFSGLGELPPEQAQHLTEIRDVQEVERTLSLLEAQPNTHYLGTPMALQHMIAANQPIGQTSIQMGYARTTDEKSEFLGDTSLRTRRRRRRDVTVNTTIAALSAPVVGAQGPRGGSITRVIDVTDRYNRRTPRSTTRTVSGLPRFTTGTRLPLYVPSSSGLTLGRTAHGTRVIVGVEQAASEYGPEVAALVGAGGNIDATDLLVTFRAFTVYETLGAYVRQNVDIPAENLCFPPWYGSHYRSQRIGGLYGYFFGTGSIVDPLTFLEPSTNLTSQLGSQLLEDVDQNRLRDPEVAAPFQDPNDSLFGQEAGPSAAQLNAPPGQEVTAGGTSTNQEITIAQAVEELTRIYSRVRQGRYDVNEFLRSYTWRPVASMVDMFGTANLEISDDGTVARGYEGFHSRAFGDFDDLRQLVRNVEGRPATILGLSTRDVDDPRGREQTRSSRDATIAANLDTRKEKREQITRYLFALAASRGILG